MSKVTAESDGRSQVGHTLEDVIVRRREGREEGRKGGLLLHGWVVREVSHPQRTKAWKQE